MARSITVEKPSFTECVINRSRFISQCFPLENEEEALALLSRVRSTYPDASHTCYAYRVGETGMTARYSDAGEPSGTAGMPILEVLRTNEITDALVTVTRYFGGILLGTGGLARAYGGGAAQAVREAGLVERLDGVKLELLIDYNRYGALEGLICERTVIDVVDYMNVIRVRTSIERSGAQAFVDEVIERSNGRVIPVEIGECVMRRLITDPKKKR